MTDWIDKIPATQRWLNEQNAQLSGLSDELKALIDQRIERTFADFRESLMAYDLKDKHDTT
jgi:hypothetical protein